MKTFLAYLWSILPIVVALAVVFALIMGADSIDEVLRKY